MTIIFIDSFDAYTTNTQMTQKGWTTTSLGIIPAINEGREGSNAVYTSTADIESITKPIPITSNIISGLAVRVTGTLAQFSNFFIEFLDSATQQLGVYGEDSTGRLRVFRNGSGGTLLGTSSKSIGINAWYFVELNSRIADTNGTFEVRVNGETWIVGTGDTKQSANAYATNVRLGLVNESYFIDDFYVCNGSGTVNNNFLGDVHIECRFPNGAGNYSDWSFTGSASAYQSVDETTPNTTDYIYANASGSFFTAAFEDLSVPAGSVYGVQMNHYATKDDAGTRRIDSVARIASSNYVHATGMFPSTSYTFLSSMWENSPATNVPWTVSEINNSEFGVKLTN